MSTLQYHGIEGQKWGVRRFQNPDGSLTPAGRRRYRKELRNDKFERFNLETDAYDSGKIANLYAKKLNSYTKKYEKALAYDPDKNDKRTVRIENTYNNLSRSAAGWEVLNMADISKLKNHVDGMINKYSDTKIKDVKTKYTKYGTEFIKSASARIANANAHYNLTRVWNKHTNSYTYIPRKTKYYYVPIA